VRALGVLLAVRLGLLARLLRDRDVPRLLVATAFLVVLVGVMAGEFHILLRGFRTLAGLGVAGPPLTLYALEAFFAVILVVGILSSVATGSTVFFRVAENRLLLAAPVPLRAIFLLRALETFALTSWAFLVLAVPALLALGVSWNRAGGFYVVGGLLVLGFLVVAGGLGTLLTMAFGAGLGHFRSRLGILALTGLLLAVTGGVVGRTVIPTRADFMAMFEPGTLNGTTVALHFVGAKFAGWPSHPYAASLFGLATGLGAGPGRALAFGFGLPVLVAAAAYGVGGALFRRAVWTASEGFLIAHAAPAPGRRAIARRVFPRVLRGPVGALLEKEVLTLARSPHEVARGAFLAFLLLVCTLLFLQVPMPDRAGTEDVTARLGAYSLLAAGYFLTTLALRFVYPTWSLDGPAAWILVATPVRLRRLFWARLVVASLSGFVSLGGISLTGGVRLGLSASGLALLGALLLLESATIMAVALALGVCWPDFRGRSADALATSVGGLTTTAICLGYVAMMGWIGGRLLFGQLTGTPAERLAGWLLAAVVLSVLTGAGPVCAAGRRAATVEVR
jgi:ABC-2 type transport system permease protein